MKKVVFKAPVLTQSGYGVHARCVAKWLLSRKDFDVKFILTPWGDTPFILNTDDVLIHTILQNSIPEPNEKFDISFQLLLPNEWNTSLANYNVGMSACVETDKCNPEWITCCNKMNAVVVPSQHIVNTLKNTGNITVPLHVIPESYISEVVSSQPSNLELDTNFNFLVLGQMTSMNSQLDRKNVHNTVKLLLETFKDDKDVGIVLKTNAGHNSKLDKQIILNYVKSFVKDIRKDSLYPKIHVIHGPMSNSDIASLYKHPKIKALVSLTKGEGFGLPLLEAAVSGLPVIATGWSAHTEFLNLGKYIDVSYTLSDIPKQRIDNKIFVAGSKWAIPTEGNAKFRITKFREKPEVPTQWAKELSVILKEKYSHKSICELYNKVFCE